MTPAERDRLSVIVQRCQAAIDAARERHATLTVIRRALVPRQAERRLRKFHMGRR